MYRAEIEGKQKTFGILGETHIYRPEEHFFAERVMDNYDLLAREGGNNNGMYIRDLAILPTTLAFSPAAIIWNFRKTGGLCDMPNVKDIAIGQGKTVYYFEDKLEWWNYLVLPFAGIAFSTLEIISLGLNLFDGSIRENGDPYAPKGKKNKYLNEDYDPSKKFPSRIYNIKKRDKYMAEKASEIIGSINNRVLISCGLKHMKGIESNLWGILHGRIELVKQERPNYN